MTTTSSVRVEGSSSPLDYIEHLMMQLGRHRHTLRVTVHLDGYEAQSYGLVERWDGKQWQDVARIRGAALQTKLDVGYSLAFRRDAQHVAAQVQHAASSTRCSPADAAWLRTLASFFKADRDALVTLAEEVL